MEYDPSNLQHESHNDNRPVDGAIDVGQESLAAIIPMRVPQSPAQDAEPLAAALPPSMPHSFRPRLDECIAEKAAELLARLTAFFAPFSEPGT